MYKIFLTLTICSQLFSNDYSLLIDKHTYTNAYSINEDYDGTLSVVGLVNEVKNNSYDDEEYNNAFDYLEAHKQSNGISSYIVKINQNAKISKDITINLNRYSQAIKVIKTPNNGYIIGGYTNDGKLYIASLTSNFSQNFIKFFGTKNYDRLSSLKLLRDGGVIAIGSSMSTRNFNDDLYNQGLGLNDIFITRFSKDGKMLWSKKYGSVHDDSGVDIAEANDGSLFVLATTTRDKFKHITVLRLSEEGEKFWLKEYKSNQVFQAKKIISLLNGNFLVLLQNQNNLKKNQLVEFDIQKNIINETSIELNKNFTLNDISQNVDGSFIAVGEIYNDTYQKSAFAIKIDKYLKPIWKNYYNMYDISSFNSLKIMDNSQIAVAGYATHNSYQHKNIWVIKLEQDGSVASSRNGDDLHKQLFKLYSNEITNNEIKIYKNLDIQLNALYFKSGEYKLSNRNKQKINIFFKKFRKFLIHNKNKIISLNIKGQTSSTWKTNDEKTRYVNNLDLSSKRAISVSKELINSSKNKYELNLITKLLEADAQSYKNRVVRHNIEDKKESRKVVISIDII